LHVGRYRLAGLFCRGLRLHVEEILVLIDRRSLRQHLPWIIIVVLATAAASAWYFTVAKGAPRLPGGSSQPGWWFGAIVGVIMFFEFFLWPRKKVRTWRIGRAQTWMRAHIWFGLLTVPLVAMHSGFRFGGALSAWLLIFFIAVIVSGLWGLLLQNIIPKRMLTDLPAETIYSQIDHVAGLFAEEGEVLVAATVGREAKFEGYGHEERNRDFERPHLVKGRTRTVGAIEGRVLETIKRTQPVHGAEFLDAFFEQSVKGYLLKGRKSGSGLVAANRASAIFNEVKSKIPKEAHEALSHLEGLCQQRRQFDRQRTLHRWLHSWLMVHLPISVAVMVLMCVHIFVTWKFW
jgi:hypothetical protein